MKSKNNVLEGVHTTRGSVFHDLGFKNADELAARVDLAIRLYDIIKERRLTQVQVAEIIGISQPKVSCLLNGELRGFSSERLMRFITALGHDVEIRVSKKPKSSGAGITVHAGT